MTAILPLSALGDVDWASLEHAYGEAVDVPETLRAIAGGDPAQRAQARSWLHACLDHQGVQRGEATLRAVPYLLGLIADAAVAERGAIAGLVAELAVGDTCWFLHDGFHPDLQPNPDDCARAQHAAYLTGGDIQIRSFPSPGGSLDMTPGHGLRELYEAIAAGTPQLVAALDDADPEVREGVAFLLGFLTTRADATAPALARLLAADPEARVRASAALGLSHAAKRSPSQRGVAEAALHEAWARGGSPLEQRCVAMALVRLEDPAVSALVRPALAAWLADGVPPVMPPGFPWFRIDSAPLVFCTLYLGTDPAECDDVVAAAVRGLPRVVDPDDAVDLAVWIARLAVPEPPRDAPDDATVAVAALPPSARAALDALAGSEPAWSYSDTGRALAGRGVPTARDALRAWLDDAGG